MVELPSYLSDGHTPAHTTTALRDAMQASAQELARLLPEGAGTPVEIARQVAVGVPYQTILETPPPNRSTGLSWPPMDARV